MKKSKSIKPGGFRQRMDEAAAGPAFWPPAKKPAIEVGKSPRRMP